MDDPNVIYGGDPDEFGSMDEGCGSLGELIYSNLKKGGNKTAFINGSTNKAWTFHDLVEQSALVAKALHGAGIRQNDTISIMSENRHEVIAITFGAFYLNAVVAPLNVTYTERELKHALSLSKPKLMFVSTFAAKTAIAACKSLKFVQNVVLIDGKARDKFTISLDGLVKKHEKLDFEVEKNFSKVDISNQVAVIMCSSGTTGLPKGVLTTHKNMMACLQTTREGIKPIKSSYDSPIVVLNIGPWFHVLGLVSMFMFACLADPSFVFLPKFEEAAFYRSIETYKVNYMVVVPPIMVLMSKSPLFKKYDLSSVRDIFCGAAALSKEVEDQVRARFNGKITVRQGFGMSETTYGTMTTAAIPKPGSVGTPLFGVYAKIVDASGKSLGPNQNGELCFKGDRVMKGYIDDPKATAEAIDKDGWLHSGDIGYYDEDKQFFVVDRLKELIKYKANQVPPAEIEGILLSHPKIKDCGVIGIPDEEAGELPYAFVVKQPGEELTEQEVQKFVADNASKMKWLRGGVKFIEAIPKNPSGKLLRREMRQMYKNMKSKL